MSLGDAVNKVDPSYTATTANFSVEFTQPGDSITYDITVTINYQQDLGQVPAYEAYSIGDVVEFAGSNWRVIKNSTGNEDYVTLLKERALTINEISDDYSLFYKCEQNDVYNSRYGCTQVGELVKDAVMPYYWSNTCHGRHYKYGNDTFTSYDYSGCEGHNDYEGSKVKEFLEGTYINTLGSSNLKEVYGYKIRLIQMSELQQNLGVSTEMLNSFYDMDVNNTPAWVYQNFGERQYDYDYQTRLSGYWTMTQNSDNQHDVFIVESHQKVYYYGYIVLDEIGSGVRPVINLLKSAIE